MLPWLLCAALAAAVLILCLRLLLLHRAMDELRAQLPDLMGEDTNVLLGISSRDKHARALAAALNRELRELRSSTMTCNRCPVLQVSCTMQGPDIRICSSSAFSSKRTSGQEMLSGVSGKTTGPSSRSRRILI